jgi:chaperonin cofactor prefoldin
MAMCYGNSTNALGAPTTASINVDGDLVVKESIEFKQLKRQVTLQELAISSLEKENENLKKELKEIKKFIYKKQ